MFFEIAGTHMAAERKATKVARTFKLPCIHYLSRACDMT